MRLTMSSAVYNAYKCEEGGGRYDAVVRAKLKGQYVRKYFSSMAKAKTWADLKNIEAANQGREHVEFPTALRMQAQTAVQLLEPHGVSLLEAIKIALPIIETRGKSLPVKLAVGKFLQDYRLHDGPKTAVPSVSYLGYLEDMLSPFRTAFSDKLVADVGITEIEELLASRKKAGAVTRQSYVRAISAFYGWCVRKGLRVDNPLSKLRKKVHIDEVSILSVKDAGLVINAAQNDEIGFVALALFCGIRTAEFRKLVRNARGEEHEATLDWKDVDLKTRHVFISPELDKNRHGRYVDIPGNALLWLKRAQQQSGPVMPENWRMRRQALEKRSGVNLPQNVFRHSFCSYRISLDQDYAKAAAIVGNSPAMLRKHYVRVLPKKLGQSYCKISPPK